mgnify:CR=1 FL=1
MFALVIGVLFLIAILWFAVAAEYAYSKERKEYISSGRKQKDERNLKNAHYMDKRMYEKKLAEYERGPKYASAISGGFAFGAVSGLVIFLLLSAILAHTGTAWKHSSYTHPLKALSVDSEAYSKGQGSFFLIMGTYASESGYEDRVKFIEEYKPGVFKMREIDANDMVLTENGNDPYIKRYTSKKVKVDTFWSFWHGEVVHHSNYEINVPKGTIIQDYEVNGDEVADKS